MYLIRLFQRAEIEYRLSLLNVYSIQAFNDMPFHSDQMIGDSLLKFSEVSGNETLKYLFMLSKLILADAGNNKIVTIAQEQKIK